jgi:hypothetical protein
MRKFLGVVAVVLLSLGLASTVHAKIVDWAGTLVVELGTIGSLVTTGTGVATTNNTAGPGDHITTIHFGPNNISGAVTILLTDPDSPNLLTLVGSGVSIPSSGTLGGPPGPIAPNTMALGGFFKVCILLPGCGNYLPVPIAYPLAGPPFTAGVGLGGTKTVNTFAKQAGALKISLQFNPWTIGLASMKDVSTTNTPTANGGINTNTTVTVQGFAHGPESATSSTVAPGRPTTAAPGGVIQFVSPNRVVTTEDPPSAKLAVPTILRIHFVPEPGMLLLLASGVGGLVLIGRTRMRK